MLCYVITVTTIITCPITTGLNTLIMIAVKYPSLKLKKTLGDRAFLSAAPNLWNNLPLHISLEDNFERFQFLLKTHLFRLAFDM